MNTTGIIGLGVVGRRTLVNMTEHPDFEVVTAWDPSPEACAAARQLVPCLAIARDAEAVIGGTAALVYVATPPRSHRDYVVAALAANKAIFCEKPLGIDVAASRALVNRVEASGLAAALNFVYGSAPGAGRLGEQIGAGTLGAIAGVDIRLHFAAWPRGWQVNARWLEARDQGGFVREVLSHFVFLVERLFGSATLAGASVAYPGGDAAETAITARLDAAGTTVTVAGSVGGAGPDQVECTVWGEHASYRLSDWYRLWRSAGDAWVEQLTDIADPRAAAYTAQLDNLAAMLGGRVHSMPSFREGLHVQALIEAMLESRR